MIEAFGAGKVAHDKRYAMIAGVDPRKEALRLCDGEAKPLHAGVDMNGRAACPAGTSAKDVPFCEFVEVADDRPCVEFGVGLAGVLDEAVEDVNDGRRRRCPRCSRFVRSSNKKGLAAGLGERLCDRLHSAAIGVGFDHG